MITLGSGGFPQLDFERAECTFCSACADACPEDLFLAPSLAPWPYLLSVADTCLASLAVECRSCADACEQRAIQFQPGQIAPP
ncbi:hypothetical protein GCM10023333_33960 [Ferrimonas pelagia]|uniref:4Fe-4S ferredoxin-type domain-containing protein n=1 Tax=Ferrimonas pelagia TaxID=1177826 RepID=A0ABP9FHG4_9GAMM